MHLSERHRDALAHLLFGIDKGGGGGFVQLTGEVGTGKTTLSRLLLEQLPAMRGSRSCSIRDRTAPSCWRPSARNCTCPSRAKRGSAKALVDTLNAYLLEAYAAACAWCC